MRYREVVKKLRKAGWYEVRQNGSHHQFTHAECGYVVTVAEHGGKDIPKGTLEAIEKSTGLSLKR
ncbi:MAG: type II toxin-antitoxin system HicA family toxin [Lachnospiraceae bacterium]|nr:type II toxin-antitoxin system HicA family toxin [Lachnospiraceae bacterium]